MADEISPFKRTLRYGSAEIVYGKIKIKYYLSMYRGVGGAQDTEDQLLTELVDTLNLRYSQRSKHDG